MKKILLINATKLLQEINFNSANYPNIDVFEDEDIFNKDIIELAKQHDEIYIFTDNENINFNMIYFFTRTNDMFNEEFKLIIDSSYFDPEQNDILDSMMMDITDSIQTIICDDHNDLIKYLKGIIN